MLTAAEARELLDSIAIVRNTGGGEDDAAAGAEGAEAEGADLTGLLDRALIAVMVYTFARINAVIRMKVRIILCKAIEVGCARRRSRSMKWRGSPSRKVSPDPRNPMRLFRLDR